MTVFLRLLLAHLLTDFVLLRYDKFEKKEAVTLRGYLAHGLIYISSLTLLCFPYMGRVWVEFRGAEFSGWAMLLPLVFVHIGFDKLNEKEPFSLGFMNGVFFLLRQLCPVLILFIVFPLLGAEEALAANHFIDNVLVIIIGAVLCTYFFMVLLYYIEKDFIENCFPIMDERYLTLLYRLILYFLFLAPGWIGFVLGGLWSVFIIMFKKKRGLYISKLGKIIGIPFTLIVALIVRMLIYNA